MAIQPSPQMHSVMRPVYVYPPCSSCCCPSPSPPLLRSRNFSTLTTGIFPSPLFSNPKTCPTSPPGFGTGHSRAGAPPSPSPSAVISSLCCRRRRRCLGGAPSIDSPSVRAVRGTGQGSRCGTPTTRKEIASVEVKRERVEAERGCRCGGILVLVGSPRGESAVMSAENLPTDGW